MAPSDGKQANWLTRERLLLAGLLVFTLAVRGGVLYAMRGNLEKDPDAYREIAENLLKHGEFARGEASSGDASGKPMPTAYRPPLYPVVLSNLPTRDGQHVSLVKVAVLHVLLGMASAWLTWLTAKRLLSPKPESRVREMHLPPADLVRFTHSTIIAPLLASVLIACDPILLNQQSLVMTETLATSLSVLALWCLVRFDTTPSWFNAALAGGAIGLAVLCRPTFLPWLAMVAMGMLFFHKSAGWLGRLPLRLAEATALVIVAAAIISPWAIRNYRVFGKPIITTTHGGYTLYLGNNRSFYAYLMKGDFRLPWEASSLERIIFAKDQPLTEEKLELLWLLSTESSALEKELERQGHFWLIPADPDEHREVLHDRVAKAMAFDTMREHPSQCIYACLYRIGQLWSALPHKAKADESTARQWMRYATCAWYYGIYALAAVGAWRLRWRLVQPPWIWGVLLCLAFTAVHTFYWTNLRMRAPLMPFVALVAAAGASYSFSGRSSTLRNSIG